MSKIKIIVAGAGHGGLTAAAKLAENGFDVTVLEARAKSKLGYDWRDCCSYSVAMDVGLGNLLKESDFRTLPRTSYYVASATTPIVQSEESVEKNSSSIERKLLIDALVSHAKDCGAKVRFGVRAEAPIIENSRVVGVKTSKGEYRADLIIDAAGVDSPLRSQLPPEFGIDNTYAPGEVLYTFRGYYNKEEKYAEPVAPYEIFIYLLGIRGLSWCITEEDCVDMLIGCFAPIDDSYVGQMLDTFRIRRPQLGRKLIRGGEVNSIPTRRPLAQMVCDGYAAVGDSAFMTEPMTGSGINLSMKAGIMLADAVIADESESYTVEKLWPYNREYILANGGSQASMDILKNVMLGLEPEELDFLLKKKIISENDMTHAGSDTSAADLFGKITRGVRQLPSIIKLGGAISKGSAAKKIYSLIPYDYEPQAVEVWKQQVSSTVVPLVPNN